MNLITDPEELFEVIYGAYSKRLSESLKFEVDGGPAVISVRNGDVTSFCCPSLDRSMGLRQMMDCEITNLNTYACIENLPGRRVDVPTEKILLDMAAGLNPKQSESLDMLKRGKVDPKVLEENDIYVLEPGIHTLGRAADNDVVIIDHTISRHHATIQVLEDVAVVNDLGSLNLTHVNREYADTLPLEEYDLLGVGQSVCWFFRSYSGQGILIHKKRQAVVDSK